MTRRVHILHELPKRTGVAHVVLALPVAAAFHAGLLWIIRDHALPRQLEVAPTLAVVLAPAAASPSTSTVGTAAIQDTPRSTASPSPRTAPSSTRPAQQPVVTLPKPTALTEEKPARVALSPAVLPTQVPQPAPTDMTTKTSNVGEVTPAAAADKDAAPPPIVQPSPSPKRASVANVAVTKAKPRPRPELAPAPSTPIAAAPELEDELDEEDDVDMGAALLPTDPVVSDVTDNAPTDLTTTSSHVVATNNAHRNHRADDTLVETAEDTSPLDTTPPVAVAVATQTTQTPAHDNSGAPSDDGVNTDIATVLSPVATASTNRQVDLQTEIGRLASIAASTPADLGQIRADHEATIHALIKANKRYPQRALRRGDEGVARVRFTINRDGSLVSSELKASSGHRSLDRETLALINRVSAFPPIPAELSLQQLTVTVPVRFSL